MFAICYANLSARCGLQRLNHHDFGALWLSLALWQKDGEIAAANAAQAKHKLFAFGFRKSATWYRTVYYNQVLVQTASRMPCFATPTSTHLKADTLWLLDRPYIQLIFCSCKRSFGKLCASFVLHVRTLSTMLGARYCLYICKRLVGRTDSVERIGN